MNKTVERSANVYIFRRNGKEKRPIFYLCLKISGMRHFATVVIGGGAAGIMAAGVAASRRGNVLLCERMEKPQRKVRIPGKGRCNLTNLCSEEEFLAKVRCGADFFASALHRFNS